MDKVNDGFQRFAQSRLATVLEILEKTLDEQTR